LARAYDFTHMTQYLTLDVITDVAFGEAFGDLAGDEDVHEYLTTIRALMPVVHWLQIFPSLVSLVEIPWIG
jgi:hypothetical protein